MKSSKTNNPPHLLDPEKLQRPVIGMTFHDSRSGHGSKVASNLSFLCVSRLLNNTHTLERRGGSSKTSTNRLREWDSGKGRKGVQQEGNGPIDFRAIGL